jgi:hypothetical protein
MIEADLPLSPQGQRRREEIGHMARITARQRRRRRVAGRGALVTLLISAIGGAWWLSGRLQAPLSVTRVVVPPSPFVPQPLPISPTSPRVVVDRIETDPTITARLSIGRTTPRWQMVGDDELLRTLADAGQPAGLIRMNGQEILMTR